MSWEIERATSPVAKKDYPCQASVWIDDAGLKEDDYSEEDWAVIEKAKAENWMIKKGTQYSKIEGKWEGEFSVFRARVDLDNICHKYQLYPDS